MGVLKTTPNFTDLVGGIMEYTVILMAVIYYNERIQSKINKGKGSWGKVPGNQVQVCEGTFPSGVPQGTLNFCRNEM